MTNLASDYETQDRVSLLKGAISGDLGPLPDEPSLDMGDPSTLVPKARQALVDIMRDPGEKASDRREAADSILDRYGEPRRKFEMGGSKTLNIQLPPEAILGALSSLSTMLNQPSSQPLALGRGESVTLNGETLDIPFAIPPKPLVNSVHQQGLPIGETTNGAANTLGQESGE